MTKLAQQLREFHKAFGHHIGQHGPRVPPEATLRLRARLIIQEFCELLNALFPNIAKSGYEECLLTTADNANITVDLIELADAMADLDYVVEGTRLAFGIDGEPIADLVHAANMAKRGGGKDEHGKTGKPPGWKPPDIEGELQRQCAHAEQATDRTIGKARCDVCGALATVHVRGHTDPADYCEQHARSKAGVLVSPDGFDDIDTDPQLSDEGAVDQTPPANDQALNATLTRMFLDALCAAPKRTAPHWGQAQRSLYEYGKAVGRDQIRVEQSLAVKRLQHLHTCIVCKCLLHHLDSVGSAPPHCMDCTPTDEQFERWEHWTRTLYKKLGDGQESPE